MSVDNITKAKNKAIILKLTKDEQKYLIKNNGSLMIGVAS